MECTGRTDRCALTAVALVLVTSLLHVWYAGAVPLTAREAYAWQASRHLDWSYLDHPPLLAWSIAATTGLLGTGERTVRLAGTLHAAVAAWFFFLAARRLAGPRIGLVALLAALSTPLFALGQAAASPEAPLLAGWCAALWCALRALDGSPRWLVGAGVAAGVAALAHHAGLLVAPQLLVLLAADARGRRLLRGPWPWVGLLAGCALYLPVLLWNAGHGGAGLLLPFRALAAAPRRPPLVRVMAFLGAQALLVTPVLGGVLWVSAAAAALHARQPALRACAVFAVPALAVPLALSPFVDVRPAWTAAGYVGALLAAALFLAEAPRARRGVAVLAIATGVAATTWLHLAALLPALPFPPRELATAGWRELAPRVDAELRRIPGSGFVLGCSPELASALAFYLPDRPATFSANVMGEPALQYGDWAPRTTLAGREGIVVLDRRDRNRCVRRAEVCAPLERLRPLVVRRGKQPVTTFELWRCRYRAR